MTAPNSLPRWQRLAILSAEADARAERARKAERREWRRLATWAVRQAARFILLERKP